MLRWLLIMKLLYSNFMLAPLWQLWPPRLAEGQGSWHGFKGLETRGDPTLAWHLQQQLKWRLIFGYPPQTPAEGFHTLSCLFLMRVPGGPGWHNLRNCYRERITHPQSHKWADTELGPPPVVMGPSPHSSSGKDASQTPLLAPHPQRCLSGEVFQTPPRASLIQMETDGKSSTTVELRAHLQTPVPRSKVKC